MSESDGGHIAGGVLEDDFHPGTPRSYFGPLKTDPDQMFVYTSEDLSNLDHFLGFMVGNGQMVFRVDPLCSQHVAGRKDRGVMGVHHADAWGAEAFAHFRCRPAGQLHNHLLLGDDRRPLEPGGIGAYRQQVELDAGVLETSYDFEGAGASGRSGVTLFVSQADPSVIVLRFRDRVDVGRVERSAAVHILVPYSYRGVETFAECAGPALPPDNTAYAADGTGAHWVDYAFSAPHNATAFTWYGRAAGAGGGAQPTPRRGEAGGLAFTWDCPAGEETVVDIVYAVVSDRTSDRPREAAAQTVGRIADQGIDGYRDAHTAAWRRTWTESSLTLGDRFWQKQFDIARYNLLVNTGGNWLGNIALEEYAWESHMLDSVAALNALSDWGHVGMARRGFEAIDRLYDGAVDNTALVADYIGSAVDGEAALLPTFVTFDGRVGLYVINHFMLHSEQNAGHALGLLNLADYTGDDQLRRDVTYKWLAAYANYALLISEWNEQRGGYVMPVWKGGTLDESQWWTAQLAGQPVDALDSIADLFPEPIRANPMQSPADTVLSHRWVLRRAAALAERLDVDHEARRRWLEVADKLIVPEDDRIILRNERDDSERLGLIATELWGLFYPCAGSHRDFDPAKVRATLDANFELRNAHIPAWNSLFYAIAYAELGDGDRAWELLGDLTLVQDPRCIQAQDNVGVKGFVYYYFLNYAFFLIALRRMVLASVGGDVTLFPAVPDHLAGDIAFTNLPVAGGLRVSASLRGEEGEAVFTDMEGREIHRVEGRVRGVTVARAELTAGS